MAKGKAEVTKATVMQKRQADNASRSAFGFSLTRLVLFVNAFISTCKVLLSVVFLIEPCYIFLEGFFGYIPDQLEVGLT